jgi:hypothetical protein
MQPNDQLSTYLQNIKGKISNTAQVGGIETSVLDNGAARGTRIAWVNTGTGLRYKVVLDRAMDIADAFYSEHSLAWISHGGIMSPQPFANKGLDWLRTFFGGLLTTCGLSHVGGPEKDEHGDRGIHGNISNIAAEIESIVQPDPLNGKGEMYITGVMRESKIFGPSLELRRTISSVLGQSHISIRDEVTNVGNATVPHMFLYHFNFGFPLVDEGSDILWKGSWKIPDRGGDEKIFNAGNNFRKCPAPLDIHKETGEAVAFIDPEAEADGTCFTGICNNKLNLLVRLSFNKQQMPWLTNWQHWGYGEYVTGLEPGTHPPIGQANARKNNELLYLEPGQKKQYDTRIDVTTDDSSITDFLNRFK